MNGSRVINEILKREGLKPGTFAKKIGVTPTQIYDLQNGKTQNVSVKIAEKIMKVYPQYSYSWLLSGEGCVTKDESGTEEPSKLEVKDGVVRFRITDMPKMEEKPKKTGFSMFNEFSEKLRLLGYEAPQDEKGYKIIALDLADRLNRATSMSEEMVNMVSKPLLDRIGKVEKQKAMVEARAAALEAQLAAISIKEAK